MDIKQNRKLKEVAGLHGLATFFLGIGLGIIRANTSETSTTTGAMYVIIGAVVAIFTTYSIITKLKNKTNERR
mgnify:CR=1 FL=1